MSRTVRLLITSFALLGLSCSGKEVGAPEPEPGVLQLGRKTRDDGAVRMTLEVLRVSGWESEGAYAPEGLRLVANVENDGSAPVRYDGGGCGCPPLSLRLEGPGGNPCGVSFFRPMCPCWTEALRIEPGSGTSYTEIFGQGTCLDTPSEAVASFRYWIPEGDEWVARSLEVRVPVGSGSPLIR